MTINIHGPGNVQTTYTDIEFKNWAADYTKGQSNDRFIDRESAQVALDSKLKRLKYDVINDVRYRVTPVIVEFPVNYSAGHPLGPVDCNDARRFIVINEITKL